MGFVTKIHESPNLPHILTIALLPEFSGEIEVVQTAYHVSDPRLKTVSGAWSEAAQRNGCWENVSEFNARNSKKQVKSDTHVGNGN